MRERAPIAWGILDVVSEAAVVHHVVELDHARVVRAKEGKDLGGRPSGRQRRDQVLVAGGAPVGRRGPIGKEVEVGRGRSRPGRLRHEADGQVGPGEEVQRRHPLSDLFPQPGVAGVVGVGRRMDLREGRERLLGGGGPEVGGARFQLGARRGERGLGVTDDLVSTLGQEVAFPQVEPQRFRPARELVRAAREQVVLEGSPVGGEGRGRALGPHLETRLRDPDARGQEVESFREERLGAPAFVKRPLRPRTRGATHVASPLGQKAANRLHSLDRGLGPLLQGGELAQEQRHHPEDRFARVHARVAAVEVRPAVFPDLGPQEAPGQGQIDALRAGQPGRFHPVRLAEQRLKCRQRIARAVRREVGQPVVVVVHADEGGVDGSTLVVGLEEPVHPGGQGAALAHASHP